MQYEFDKFKMVAKARLEAKLKEHYDGKIKWTVGNQFDETILESALENFNEESAMKFYAVFNARLPDSIMALAHWASTFEVEPLSAAWTQ